MNDNPTLHHPLVSHLGIHNLAGCSETLDLCVAYLQLRADLFGSDDSSYSVINRAATRNAMFRQLTSTAEILEAVSCALQLEADDARTDAAADSTN